MPSSRSRRIAVLAFALIVVAGAVVTGALFAILHRRTRHDVSAAPDVARQAAAPAATPPEQPPLDPQQWKTASDDPTAFVMLAESEVTQLREGVALSQWMSARGAGEQWTATKPEVLVDGPGVECLSLRRIDALPSGATIVRALYFYPPRVPSPITFPTVDAASPFATCTLAEVRIEAEASTPDAGRAMASAIAQRFTKVYGDKAGRERLLRVLRSSGEGGGHWVGSSDILSNYDGKPGLSPNAPGQLIQGPVARVFAHLPNLEDMVNRSPLPRADRALEAAQFRRAVAAAGVAAAISQRMEQLYATDVTLADRLNQQAEEQCKKSCLPEDMPKATGSDWREPLVPVLQDWFQALKAADPAHRAAGLFAADRLLLAFESVRADAQFGGEQSSTPEQTKLRTELQNLGAEFGTGFEDPAYGYKQNWLLQAKDLDPGSEGGKLALLTWMSTGYSCDQAGAEGFRKVISEGEAMLARNIDSPTSAQIHFRVGDAYSDIVAIAGGRSGANGEYDPSQYTSEAGADRAKALAHYRAALAIDNTSQNAKDAWRQGWHLAAGLVPGERYVCFGD